MSDREKNQLVSEVNILRDFKHPNIVRYYDRVLDKNNGLIYIVMGRNLKLNGDLVINVKFRVLRGW